MEVYRGIAESLLSAGVIYALPNGPVSLLVGATRLQFMKQDTVHSFFKPPVEKLNRLGRDNRKNARVCFRLTLVDG